VIDLAQSVTKRWAKQRSAEHRAASAQARRMDALARRRRPMNLKEAAWRVMSQAYAVASDNGRLPANPRQIYYAARGPILEMTGKQRLDSNYFCQRLLVDYIEETGVTWDIVWDDRGHFREPHTDHEIGLGTLAVRNYLRGLRDLEINDAEIAAAEVSTKGPMGRYGAVLFLEKEGFQPILEAAQIPERFDVAVMSTKGMSVTAARMLVDELCGKRGLRLFVLHDFDIAGFSIKKTLTESGRRYQFARRIDFVDLGLRLADVERLELASEPVAIDKDENAVRRRLAINGASEDEIEFLLGGERVELNAMTSDVFVSFVEEALAMAGVTKVVPPKPVVEEVYTAFVRSERAQAALKEELDRSKDEAVAVPAELMERVAAFLDEHPEGTWDDAVRQIADDDAQKERPAR
jgi:hypothetical protein